MSKINKLSYQLENKENYKNSVNLNIINNKTKAQPISLSKNISVRVPTVLNIKNNHPSRNFHKRAFTEDKKELIHCLGEDTFSSIYEFKEINLSNHSFPILSTHKKLISSQKTVESYSISFLKLALKEKTENKPINTIDFNIRADIILWVRQVILEQNVPFTIICHFIYIFDYFYNDCNDTNSIELISLCCLLLSIKLEYVNAKISDVNYYSNVLYSKSEYIQAEYFILSKINYNIPLNFNLSAIIDSLINELEIPNLNEKRKITQISHFLCDYVQLFFPAYQIDLIKLSFSILYLSCNLINKNYLNRLDNIMQLVYDSSANMINDSNENEYKFLSNMFNSNLLPLLDEILLDQMNSKINSLNLSIQRFYKYQSDILSKLNNRLDKYHISLLRIYGCENPQSNHESNEDTDDSTCFNIIIDFLLPLLFFNRNQNKGD